MDILLLSRLQFAITTIYHFLFVPLTIGLGIFIAVMQTISYKTDNPEWEKITRFWGRLFLVTFAVGVVTGIVQEFQFGMNWSEYSRFVGDVFGAPLAIEALLAFFLESTFLGLWIFGRDILPRVVHLACIWIVAAASCLSAIWILIANSFMQHPVGYAFNNGRAEMTDFLALILNPYFLHQLPHTITASICTAAFFILGISAYKIRVESSDSQMFLRSFRLALFIGLIGVLGVLVTGHLQGQNIAKLQPMKLAAMENLEENADPAPLEVIPGVEVPALLSFMVHNEMSGEVKGMQNLQKEMESLYGKGNFIPPKWIPYISFRVMVGIGGIMLLIILYGLLWDTLLQKKMHKKVLLLITFGIALPYIANSAGWLIAEVGRQPWIVYKLMPTERAVSVGVSANSVLFSIFAFTIIYGILAVITIYLIYKESVAGIEGVKTSTQKITAASQTATY